MATATVTNRMLYCPKCKTKYEDGTQRFCNDDGGRLLPMAGASGQVGSSNPGSTANVFTSILHRTSANDERDETLSKNPRFVKATPKPDEEFALPKKSRVFDARNVQTARDKRKRESIDAPNRISPEPHKYVRNTVKDDLHNLDEDILEMNVARKQPAVLQTPIEVPQNRGENPQNVLPGQDHGGQSIPQVDKPSPPVNRTQTEEFIPNSDAVRQHESRTEPKHLSEKDVRIDRAELGNRATNPAGRSAISWQNPRSIVGEFINGRYSIADVLHQDQTGIAYLGEDRAIKGKRVVVRVMMTQDTKDSFQESVFAEERVSLAHINHPNVVRVIDSGELQEGNPFVVTDFIDGVSVESLLSNGETVNPMRSARIIRQASLALSEVHQAGILHRNLTPKDLLLRVGDGGVEQVKVCDFSVSDGLPRIDNLAFKPPEQLTGQMATSASDSYSLAAVAFKMLTGQAPFPHSSQKELLRAQKKGLNVLPSEIDPSLPALLDGIFIKALAFNPADRFPKSRDFGDALFNVLATVNPVKSRKEKESGKKRNSKFANTGGTDRLENDETRKELFGGATVAAAAVAGGASVGAHQADLRIASSDSVEKVEEPSNRESTNHTHISNDATSDSEEASESSNNMIGSSSKLWEQRSPEPVTTRGWIFSVVSALGVLILATLAIGAIYFLAVRSDSTSTMQVRSTETDSNISINEGAGETEGDFESPPPPTEIVPPEGYKYFENKKASLSPEMKQGYRGFSIYYPEDWEVTQTSETFLDVKKDDKDGIPYEQMLITRYDSNGTYSADSEKFPSLVKASNDDLVKFFGENYEVVDESPITLSSGWKGYQVKFQTRDPITVKGRDIQFWGRRIWIPPARPGVKTGFVITLLATSASESVQGINDVGIKGELGSVLKTFNPERDYE